jgi:hypothetical protein
MSQTLYGGGREMKNLSLAGGAVLETLIDLSWLVLKDKRPRRRGRSE